MTAGLNSSRAYKEAMLLGEIVAREVRTWRFHDRDVVGRQFERASHSIAANFAEAYGRSAPAAKRQFITYAIGSAHEAATWLAKAHQLRLVEPGNHEQIDRLLKSLIRRLTAYRRSLTRELR